MTPLQRIAAWFLSPEERNARRERKQTKREFNKVIGPRCPECGKPSEPNSYCSETCEYNGTIWMAG